MELSQMFKEYGCESEKAQEKLADSFMSLSVNLQSAVYIAVFVTPISLIIPWSITLSTNPQAGSWQPSLTSLLIVTAVVVGFLFVLLMFVLIRARNLRWDAIRIYNKLPNPAPPAPGASPTP
jgi:hypothetical protein